MNLLRRLLPSRDIDALLGDITEEARHRSRLWYWGQLCALLVVGSWRDVRRHPLLALRAVAVGLITLVVVFTPAPTLLHVVRVLSEGGYYVGPYWVTLPPHAFMWLPVALNPLGFVASGWTVVRAHRSHGIAMVLPWTLLVCVLPAIMLTLVFSDTQPVPPTAPAIGGVISTLSLPLWVVAGGLLGVRGPLRRNSRNDSRI
jgi:hypothetical protein